MMGGEPRARYCKDCAHWRPSFLGRWADKCGQVRVRSLGGTFCVIERWPDYVGLARKQGTCGAPGWLWVKATSRTHRAKRAVHGWLRSHGLTLPGPRHGLGEANDE